MKTRKKILIMMIALRALPALGGWEGWPLADQTNLATWENLRTNYYPIGQLFTAVVERCQASGVAEPSVVENWVVSAGTGQEIGTNGSGWVYTNVILCTNTVTTTNQIGPFVHSYSNAYGGSGTVTGYPHLTRAFLHSLDTKLAVLYPYFACTNEAIGGIYNVWFSTTNASGNYPMAFPMESKAGLFHRNNIGYSTNLTTNAWGFIDGGDAYFLRQPPTTSNWLLAESHYTGAWTFVDIGRFDTRMYDTSILPEIRYMAGGTNALSSLTVTITGSELNIPDQSTSATNETVNVTGTNALTLPWYDVTGISCPEAAPNTGDVLAVVWKDEVTLYGDWPYRLEVADLDERQKAVALLVWTVNDPSWNAWVADARYFGYGADWLGYEPAKTECQSNYHEVTAGALEHKPYKWTELYFSIYRGYVASAESQVARVVASGLNTNWAHTVDFYAKAERPVIYPLHSPIIYDAQGCDYIAKEFAFFYFSTEESTWANAVTSSPVSSTNFPPNWNHLPSQPEYYIPGSMGFIVRDISDPFGNVEQAIIKWDGTNGFEYQ